jgi:exonuclease VII large subunit
MLRTSPINDKLSLNSSAIDVQRNDHSSAKANLDDALSPSQNPAVNAELSHAENLNTAKVTADTNQTNQALKSSEEQSTQLKTELNSWAKSHKAVINELVSAYMPAESAEHMKENIARSNTFMTQPEIMQDQYDDQTWSYNMEAQLTSLIENHELSTGFELLNVACKQLMCDVLGIEKEDKVWFKMFISLLQSAPNAVFPNGNNDGKSLSYLNNDEAIVYSQIKFKKA